MEGIIAACGFTSGDRVVVGQWARSPIGPMADVMWAAPDGTRTLFAPSEAIAAFVTAIYDFDAVAVTPPVDHRGPPPPRGPHRRPRPPDQVARCRAHLRLGGPAQGPLTTDKDPGFPCGTWL